MRDFTSTNQITTLYHNAFLHCTLPPLKTLLLHFWSYLIVHLLRIIKKKKVKSAFLKQARRNKF